MVVPEDQEDMQLMQYSRNQWLTNKLCLNNKECKICRCSNNTSNNLINSKEDHKKRRAVLDYAPFDLFNEFMNYLKIKKKYILKKDLYQFLIFQNYKNS